MSVETTQTYTISAGDKSYRMSLRVDEEWMRRFKSSPREIRDEMRRTSSPYTVTRLTAPEQ